MYPPICKMDSALVTLKACEKLSLSTNNIEKMGSLTGLENLKILSVGKNLIKKLDGVADVGEHLEELWCSYNLIEKLTNFEKLTKLRVLYMSNNKVADFKQLEALKDAPLEEILLTGNPLKQPSEAEADEIGSEYRVAVLKQLKSLRVLRAQGAFWRVIHGTPRGWVACALSNGVGIILGLLLLLWVIKHRNK